MGNLNQIVVASLICLIFIGCGKNLPNIVEQRKDLQDKIDPQKISGILNLVGNKQVDLSGLQKKSVLFFVSESCSSCIEETKSLVALFQQKGMPINVDFYSVLIGSILPDAEAWKNFYLVPWEVGYDEDLRLYKSFFSSLVTPSILIYLPEDKKIKTIQGNQSIEDLEKETGTWLYLN